MSFGRSQLFREMRTNEFYGEAGPGAIKSGIDFLDPGAGYGAETCPVEVRDNVPFFL